MRDTQANVYRKSGLFLRVPDFLGAPKFPGATLRGREGRRLRVFYIPANQGNGACGLREVECPVIARGVRETNRRVGDKCGYTIHQGKRHPMATLVGEEHLFVHAIIGLPAIA